MSDREGTQSPYLTRAFWLGTLDRAIKTAAQFVLLLWGANAVDLLTVNWTNVLATAGGAAVVSVLTSLASTRSGDPGTTSAIPGGR